MDRWKALAVVVAAAMAVLVATQPLYVLSLTLFDYGQTPQASYSTMQTKDATRFPAEDPARMSALTARAARPPGSGLNYSTAVRVPEDDWQAAYAAARLRASEDAVLRFGDGGVGAGDGGVGDGGGAALPTANATGATTVDVTGGDAAEVAATLATRAEGPDDVSTNNVVVISGEAPEWGLPAVAWSAYSGDPILYAGEDGVPDATLSAIEELNASHAYVLSPEGLVGDEALADLDVPWTRVAGKTPQAHAVEVAEFRDESRDFGWGIHERDKVGYYNLLVTNPGDWQAGVAAANLQWGKAGPIVLSGDDGELATITENYAWQTQPAWFQSPLEGPFNHVFVMGPLSDVSWVTQGRLDYAVEITPYRMQGAGLSPLEAVVAVWAAFSLLGGAFVFAHARHRLREMSDWSKLFWPLFTLLLGPFGLALYWVAYRGRPVVETEGGKRVLRPYWLRAATATAMGVGFAASTMIGVGFLLTYFGIPMVVFEGPLFWVGNAMTLLILLVYVIAFLVSWIVFHVPMFQEMRGVGTREAAGVGLTAVAVSMTSVSVGMMGTMWVLMMLNLPMMPGDDDIMWFGVMVFATLIGFLIAWPVNGLLVRRNVKAGGVL